eukprot:785692-Amphidinium_carterae.1
MSHGSSVPATESGDSTALVTVAEAAVQTTPLPVQIEDTDDFVVFAPAAVYVARRRAPFAWCSLWSLRLAGDYIFDSWVRLPRCNDADDCDLVVAGEALYLSEARKHC